MCGRRVEQKKDLKKVIKSQSQNSIYYTDVKKINDGNYLLEEKRFTNLLVEGNDILIPLEVDKEYKAQTLACLKTEDPLLTTYPVSTQFRQPVTGVEHMFISQTFEEDLKKQGKESQIRHPILRYPFHALDFLAAEGEEVSLSIDPTVHHKDQDNSHARLPVCKFVFWAFFALADFPKLFEGECLQAFEKAAGRQQIKMMKRMIAKTGRFQKGWKAPFKVTINGLSYRVVIEIVDTCALMGQADYHSICSNAGIELTVKKEMQRWIKKMDEAYTEIPKDFDTYAMEDLKNYQVLLKNSQNMFEVWKSLHIEEYYKLPALTIGKTVDDLFSAIIFKKCGFSARQVSCTRGKNAFKKRQKLDLLTYRSSAAYLSDKLMTDKGDSNKLHLLSKCDGGRCRNAKPLITNLRGVLVDIDIGGAYSSAMSQLQYPIGNPVLISCCRRMMLKDFLKKYGSDLVPRLWYGRISTTSELSYDQDLFPSWFDVKTKSHKDYNTGEKDILYRTIMSVDVGSGENKILTREIINGALTHDLLQVVDKEWSPRQRKDFYDKVELHAIGFYPKSLKVETVEEVKNIHHLHEGHYDYNPQKLPGIEIDRPSDPHAWTSFSLGRDYIDVIKVARAQYDKDTPLNTLYKLICNTSYGDSVSKFFIVSNMIVGNNTTAMVRTMMYYAEKALNLMGSITDGQIFDLNNVVHRAKGKYLNTGSLPRIYIETTRDLKRKNICDTAPLNKVSHRFSAEGLMVGARKYLYENSEGNNEAEEYVNKSAYEHVCKVFPHNDLINDSYQRLKPQKEKGLQYEEAIGIFEFEMKIFLKSSTHRGSADYQYEDIFGKVKTKMRSYESKKDSEGTLKKQHVAYDYILQKDAPEGQVVYDYGTYESQSPAEKMMEQLNQHPECVEMGKDFIKEGLLKLGDWSQNHKNKWSKALYLSPGDTIMKTGRFGYLSLTQFTFRTVEEYKNWHK